MPNDEERELMWLRYQEVKVKHVSMKGDKPLGSKADHKFMAKAAKAQAKEDRKRGR